MTESEPLKRFDRITDGPKILKTLTYNHPNERYLGIIGVVADTFTNNSNFGREIDV